MAQVLQCKSYEVTKLDIRKARQEDRDCICSLWEKLIGTYGQNTSKATLIKAFNVSLASKNIHILVAEIEGQIVGTGTLHTGHYSTWTDTWYGHMEDIYVHEDFRRMGIARGIVQELLDTACKLGLSRVELHTLKTNKKAQELYESIGFRGISVLYDYNLAQLK